MRYALLALLITYVSYATFGPAQYSGGEPGAESPEALLAKLEVFADDTETGPMVLARHASPLQPELTAWRWGLDRLDPYVAFANARDPELAETLELFHQEARKLLERHEYVGLPAFTIPRGLDVHAFVNEVTVLVHKFARHTGAELRAPDGIRRSEIVALRDKMVVDGDQATGTTDDGRVLAMERVDGRWYIDVSDSTLTERLRPRRAKRKVLTDAELKELLEKDLGDF